MNEKQREILEKRFNIYENGNKYELEAWTNGGVNMFIYYDSSKQSIIECLNSYIDNFDMDEEIDCYRQDERYRNDFAIRESIEDFENWIDFIQDVIKELESMKGYNMNKKELLEQLKSLEVNQRDFISNDDTGVFERDCKALELAYTIINEIDLKELECVRICSDCGNIMNAGYCIHDGEEYYCSDECLYKHYTNDEYNELYDNGNGDSYWTEWEN